MVHSGIPVHIDYAAELIAPSEDVAKTIKSARLCGVRMRTGGFQDYTPAHLLAGQERKVVGFKEGESDILTEFPVALDNGYVQFRLLSGCGSATANGSRHATNIYVAPVAKGTRLAASYSLEITGQSQFAAPIISPAQN